jgi:hypothetical protein
MPHGDATASDALDECIKLAFAQYYVASRAVAVNREVIATTRGTRVAAEIRYAAGRDTIERDLIAEAIIVSLVIIIFHFQFRSAPTPTS